MLKKFKKSFSKGKRDGHGSQAFATEASEPLSAPPQPALEPVAVAPFAAAAPAQIVAAAAPPVPTPYPPVAPPVPATAPVPQAAPVPIQQPLPPASASIQAPPPAAVEPSPAAPAPAAPPKARIVHPRAPAPLPEPTPPPKRHGYTAPVQSATIVEGQGLSDGDKRTHTVPGGIPGPDWAVARSTLPKEDQFRDAKPYNFIRELVDMAPPGLLGSIVGDVQDLSYAYMDVNFLREIQAMDNKKKGLACGTVVHAIGDALQRELAAYQQEKYAPRGVTATKDFQWGVTAEEFYVTTHAEMLDGNNSRTGSWTAKWKINAQNIPGVNEAEVSGDVRVRTWCYEDCTAHMSGSQFFAPVTLQGDEEKPLAKVIKMQIAKWEKEVVEALGTVYDSEMDVTLKAIRRTLPITRQRLRWELVASRAVKNREMKKK